MIYLVAGSLLADFKSGIVIANAAYDSENLENKSLTLGQQLALNHVVIPKLLFHLTKTNIKNDICLNVSFRSSNVMISCLYTCCLLSYLDSFIIQHTLALSEFLQIQVPFQVVSLKITSRAIY